MMLLYLCHTLHVFTCLLLQDWQSRLVGKLGSKQSHESRVLAGLALPFLPTSSPA